MALVKICGLNDPAGLEAALAGGADMIGLVFFPPSPRALTAEAAGALARRAPRPSEGGPLRVGLFVDADDATIARAAAEADLDILQLHGEETPARAAALRAAFTRPVVKALGIATAADLDAIRVYEDAVDGFLLDAKAPPEATRPGGNATSFDWSLLRGLSMPVPWLLAGGLTPDNVAEAIRQTGAPGVDVSSGVERERGVKDPALVAAFLAAARGAAPAGTARRAKPGPAKPGP